VTDIVNAHLAANRPDRAYPVAPALTLKDGSVLSVQASSGHYCTPKANEGPYSTVEVMVCQGPHPRAFIERAGRRQPDGVYPFMRVSVVNAVIESRGGVA
jgi:hypothetical protein